MQLISYPPTSTWENITERPTPSFEDIEQTVADLFKEVQSKGENAIFKYTELFDGVALKSLVVNEDEIKEAISLVDDELKQAISLAKHNIEAFHQAQKTPRIEVETQKGVKCWQEKRPIQKVGLYIPGGSAPLFSSVLMLAIPAKIAGCEEIVLCSPPNKEGKIHPAIIYAAQLCGVTKIFKVGGIQAIAGMTFGTTSVPKVFKILGPGNQFVTVAKQYATRYNIAIDMPAGPSELLVMADESAIPSFVAADLLSQAEHGPDSQVILVSTSTSLVDKVQAEIKLQLQNLPRVEVATKAIANSKIILLEDNQKALDFINAYAPEHFIVATKDNAFFVENIQNAGSVFVGNYTPESAGDYASGTNHTLPTNAYARQYSGVNLDSFTKSITFQEIQPEGIKNIGKAVELMAEAEGLFAHKNAMSLRMNYLEEAKNK